MVRFIVEFRQERLFLQDLPMNHYQRENCKNKENQPAVHQKYTDKPQVQEDIDRVARKREDPTGNEFPRSFEVKPYSP